MFLVINLHVRNLSGFISNLYNGSLLQFSGLDGLAEGLADGLADGFEDGLAEGFVDGLADGFALGDDVFSGNPLG